MSDTPPTPPRGRPRLAVAAGAGAFLLLVVLALSALVSGERPVEVTVDGARAAAAETAARVLAPTLAGGDCPDVGRPPTGPERAAERDLVTAAREAPDEPVPDPRDPDAEMPLGEVPPLIAAEIESCLRRTDTPSPSWGRLAGRLRP